MGEVYRARDTRLGRTVAIKVLPAGLAADPDQRCRFELEARAVSALNHEHICTLYDIGSAPVTLAGQAGSPPETGGVTLDYLVMEYLEGQTLADRLKAGPLPLDQVLRFGVELADALDKAHRHGIVHRDLKPGNVMLTEGGAKLLDFGVATLAITDGVPGAERSATSAALLAGRLLGTPYYMSPEQARGLAADRRSDIFGLGVLLYEAVTGRRPFEGGTLVEVLASILHDAPVSPTLLNPQVPLRLGRIIDRCLAKDPAARWSTMGDLRQRLEELGADLRAATRAMDRSVAVLPFADMSPEHDQEYLCEGFAEEILTALSHVKGLRVASRPSAFRFKAPAAEYAEIGTRLQVSAVLDGSVRKSGDRLRITIKLTDVADGYCLWSERYERDMRDVFAIQDQIARSVVTALEMTISAAERESIQRLTTADVDAYDCYLRGRSYFFKYTRKGVAFARELFERAIGIDPGFARAYAGFADCCTYQYLYARRDAATLEQGLTASRRALEIDSQLAEAHAALGTALSLAGRHEEAEAAFQEAIRQNPYLFEAHYFYARDSFAQGRIERAVQQYEDASRVRPEDYQAPLLVAQIHEDVGHADAARASRLLGVALAEAHLKLNPDDARALYMGANGLVALGETEKGLVWARRAAAMDADDAMTLYNVGCVFSLAGKAGEALDCLEQAVDAGLTQRAWFERDSNLDFVRNTPRFQVLLARLP
jgi:serine/threonine protein kinase/tetratricopeptide (TPR) repeat protein